VSAAMLGVTTTAQAGVALSGGMLYGDVGSCYINIEGTGSAYAGGCHYDKQDTITGQHVSIKAGSDPSPQKVFGAVAYNGDASGNSVDMMGGQVDIDVTGGASVFEHGNASKNEVVISGGEVGGPPWHGTVAGGTADHGD